MDDKVLVNYYYDDICSEDEPQKVCSFYTSRFAEWIMLLDECKKRQITFWVRSDDERIKPELVERMNMGCFIKDISVSFGSDTVVQGIDVVLE